MHYRLPMNGLEVLALDTLVEGHPYGCLGRQQLAWLDDALYQTRGTPTLIAMHHPPFLTGVTHMDKMGLQDAKDFEAILVKYKHVERIICGHVHRPVTTRFAGTVASIAPSVAHQVALDLQPNSKAAFVFEPGGMDLHVLTENGRVVSHTQAVGEYGKIYYYEDFTNKE